MSKENTISVQNILFKENEVVLFPNTTMKYSNISRLLDPLQYQQYPKNSRLYFVNYLKILLTFSKDAG